MKRVFLVMFLALPMMAQEAPGTPRSGTNTVLISNEVLKRRWSRTAVMADEDNLPLEPTGQVVATADVAAIGAAAERAGEIGDSARIAMTNAISELASVTNQIPDGAQHIAISIPSLGSPNLQGMVIDEGSEGLIDWQVVRFNQLLSLPPSRTVEYVYAGGTASVECVWDYPWSTDSTDHRCVFPRPPIISGDMVIRSRRQEKFGGPKGFSFGSGLVTVDRVPTFTGAITNSATGQVLTFDNGVLR